jgi:hypothetical protein
VSEGRLFDEPTILRAWERASSDLVAQGSHPTFIAVSAGPGFPAPAATLASLDLVAAARGAEKPSTVANVLLPRVVSETAGSTLDKVGAGLSLFGRGRRRGLRFSGWRNTYFERFVGRWFDSHLVAHTFGENRLASIIEKIGAWGKDVEAGLYVHTAVPDDKLRIRGSPCLQYVQVRLYSGNRLELYSLYRSHDYFNKALGNMVGLQRLGMFIAGEAGRIYTGQTVFSLHPFVPSGCVQGMKGLVADVAGLSGF